LSRYLDPTASLEEVLFGLIMVLSFTVGAGLIVGEGPDATRTLLIGVVSCNIAWGLIDGAMYLIDCMLERSRKSRIVASLQRIDDDDVAIETIGRYLDGTLAALTSNSERRTLYRAIYDRLRGLQPERARLTRDDLLAACATCVLVIMTTIPAVVPFFFIADRVTALRASNTLLLAAIFFAGFRWARATQGNAWLTGSVLLLLGASLVAVAVALGG